MSMSDWSIFAALRCAIFVSSESTVKWECSERWRPKWHCFSLSGTCKRHTGTLLHTFSSEKTVTIVTHLDRPQRRHQVWAAGECPIGHFGVPLLFLPRCLISGRPLTLITGSFSLLAASPRASFGPSKRSFESPLVRVPKYPITYIYIIDGGCIYVSAGSEEAVVVEGAVEWDGIGVSARQRNNTLECACNICSRVARRLRPLLAPLRVPAGQAHCSALPTPVTATRHL